MPPANLPLTSREYKLMLDTSRFHDRAGGSGELLALARFIVEKEGGAYVEQGVIDEDKGEKTRRTWYLDTPEKAFGSQGFILRVRREKEKEFALNLKFRGADRYLSASADVSYAPAGAKTESKFEEDVLPPFVCRFSRSTSVKKLEKEPAPENVDGAAALFPGLGALGIAGKAPVGVTDGFRAHEVVRKTGGFRFGDGPVIKMSQSFWYLREAMDGYPMVAELSYDYDAPEIDALEADPTRLETFPLATVRGAHAVFRSLQLQSAWLDPAGTTKSAFAAGGM
jgi:hypothetical protein